jgi:hypothetical protein
MSYDFSRVRWRPGDSLQAEQVMRSFVLDVLLPVSSPAGIEVRASSRRLLLIESENKKSPENDLRGFLMKDWRLPTLAEAIQPLPSAMQRLTAVFGMGTGRTTAVLPPKCWRTATGAAAPGPVRGFLTRKTFILKIVPEPEIRRFSENYTQEPMEQFHNSRVEIAFSNKFEKSNQAARPISAGQLNTSRCLHFQPIKRVVCPWSLGTCVRETLSWEELGT